MKNLSKKTVKINEDFKCEQCGYFNQKAAKTCRNHCLNCLYSKHLDQNLPGDRNSQCYGLMEPLKIDYEAKKGFKILHQCLKCKKQIFNKSSADDNLNAIIKIMKYQNLNLNE